MGCYEDRTWCPGADLNHRHLHFQCSALPTELPGRRDPLARGPEKCRRYRGFAPDLSRREAGHDANGEIGFSSNSISSEDRFPLFRITLHLSMILSDLPSPAEAGFAKAGNRFPLFGIVP